jgi:hypothetical protein
MDLAHDQTPLFGFMAFRDAEPPMRVPTSTNVVKALAIAGAAALVILLCTIGAFLFSQAFCPCTVGSEPGPGRAPQQAVVTTSSPYDVASCVTPEVTEE